MRSKSKIAVKVKRLVTTSVTLILQHQMIEGESDKKAFALRSCVIDGALLVNITLSLQMFIAKMRFFDETEKLFGGEITPCPFDNCTKTLSSHIVH